MPQMAPILWAPLLIFFILSLSMFFLLNFFIKPFEKKSLVLSDSTPSFKHWSL
uniref:ATP synthase complex subunit 8 n=1 Tax=Ocypode cordimanus TaxID=652466 RepID=A0A140GMA9_9EUCA|nr:ATP synthase F0 subunit 8 [Ocypode cordimanus]AMN14545.1 ATP synthase F0 subunit 8 [Ocypode cordimanus]